MQDLSQMYYEKTETITERVTVPDVYHLDFIKAKGREISDKYEVEFRPAKEGEKYINDFSNDVSVRVTTFNHYGPTLVVVREIINQIQEVYKTATLDIPEGYKVIAFRFPVSGDLFVNSTTGRVETVNIYNPPPGKPRERVILEESYTEEIVPDRVGLANRGEKYWDDDSQKWSTATVQWGLFKRVIGKVVKKPCPASVFTQGDLDKLVK